MLRIGSAWSRACGKDARSHHCCSTFYLLRVAVKWFSADADMAKDMVCSKVKKKKKGGWGTRDRIRVRAR